MTQKYKKNLNEKMKSKKQLEIIAEKERKSEMNFLMRFVKTGKWKGHARGIEYVTTFDEDIFNIDGYQVRIRTMLMVHSQFLSKHIRVMMQVKEKCVFSTYVT